MTVPMIVLAVGSAFLGLVLGPTGADPGLAGAGRRREPEGEPGARRWRC